MKRIYSSQNLALVHHLSDILEHEGIVCMIKNENLFMAAGHLPPLDCWPELWLADDSQYDQACKIIDDVLSSEMTPGESWKCTNCGERHEPQFTDCWNCGASRPEGKEA